jgi:hypothetical protein
MPIAAISQTTPAPAASPTPLREVGTVTVAAKDFYRRLVGGNIDRSRLTDEMNSSLTSAIVSDTSAQLGTLGNPLWQFVGAVSTSAGPVYVYSLRYDNGTVLYYSFGMNAQGKIFTAFIGQDKPAGV